MYQLPRGLFLGIAGAAVILPLMFAVMSGIDWVWRQINFAHPSEHDLLKILAETSSAPMRTAIILSAIGLAPVFEEFLFRGYLQTALAATVARWTGRSTRPCWPAILLASIAFTAVHEHLWLMPPIFFLSLCLGYVYERTSNLWAVMFIHAAFNAASTAIFLITR